MPNGLIRLSAHALCCINALHRNVPYFVMLLCLMPDDFTCHGESAAAELVDSNLERTRCYYSE
jgi:hypothetical protein